MLNIVITRVTRTVKLSTRSKAGLLTYRDNLNTPSQSNDKLPQWFNPIGYYIQPYLQLREQLWN